MVDNMRAAATVTNFMGIEKSLILSAIKKTKTLKHRLELVGEFNDIIFYDDAISTTPESTIVAIDALKDVNTILLGGFDRGYDFRELGERISISNIENIVLFPETGERILTFLDKNNFNILRTEKMEEAISFAYEKTRKNCICLLSTASPSYSLWKNFEEKGNEFVECVKKLARQES
jgi:UDP-N-acetylmuramoylalanine--D-glutamate ligase